MRATGIWDRKPTGWIFTEEMCWLLWKQNKYSQSPHRKNSYKIISNEIWYLFITTSMANFLPPLVLTDWSSSALAPSHRWHLHLSWPKCWGGEGESTQTTILHKELQNESWGLCLQHLVPFDKSLHQVSLLYDSPYFCLLQFLLKTHFPTMDCTLSIGDGLMEMNGEFAKATGFNGQTANTKSKVSLTFSLVLYDIKCSFPIAQFCVMWVTHTSLAPLMPLCLSAVTDIPAKPDCSMVADASALL